MKTKTSLASNPVDAGGRRIVLCVDPDESYAGMLDNAWRQLQLNDELPVPRSRAEALEFLDVDRDGGTRPAAVVVRGFRRRLLRRRDRHSAQH